MARAHEIYGKKWSEKEYLITLHAYFEHMGEPQHADTPFVQELSHILGRTPHSILYRLQNYASIDPTEMNPYRKGKVHITDLGIRIFQEWSSKRDSLRDAAEAFLRDEQSQMIPDLFNPSPVRLPVTFRDYELLDEVGRGSFGIVFSCISLKDGKTFAIKIIDGSKLWDRECVHRFTREIRALKVVDHPHVIRIFADNLDNEKDYPGFVMDLAETSLTQYLGLRAKERTPEGQRPVLEFEEAKEILSSVVDAVEALHQSNPTILHRDINPNNILRRFDGKWVLADFSLAKFLPAVPVSTSFATSSHMAMGTLHYTAPEQCRSLQQSDVRSDIFSLGWLLWELFSTEGPYVRREPTGLPQQLEHAFLKATSFEKEHRFGSVTEFRNAIEMPRAARSSAD